MLYVYVFFFLSVNKVPLSTKVLKKYDSKQSKKVTYPKRVCVLCIPLYLQIVNSTQNHLMYLKKHRLILYVLHFLNEVWIMHEQIMLIQLNIHRLKNKNLQKTAKKLHFTERQNKQFFATFQVNLFFVIQIFDFYK